MLTSYWVRCPHAKCGWSGSLLPRETYAARQFEPAHHKQVAFQCPRCAGEWYGRIVNDDVQAMPLDALSLSK